jgi:hypothetical protein
MDPLTLIVTALVTGGAAALQDTATDAVKDAYRGLKGLIQRRFAGKPEAEVALTQAEKKPEVWQEPLKDALKESRADQDEEIVSAAQKLMGLLDPQQASAGKYNVQIAGNVQGFAQGDYQHVEMNFGEKS